MTGGPSRVPRDTNPVLAACLDAAEEVGYRRADDISGGLEEGFGWTELNIVSGRRQSALEIQHDGALWPGRADQHVAGRRLVNRLRRVRDLARQEAALAGVAHSGPAGPSRRHIARL